MHEHARDALRELWDDGTGLLCPQVLQEFYVNVMRKSQASLAKDAASLAVSTYAFSPRTSILDIRPTVC